MFYRAFATIAGYQLLAIVILVALSSSVAAGDRAPLDNPWYAEIQYYNTDVDNEMDVNDLQVGAVGLVIGRQIYGGWYVEAVAGRGAKGDHYDVIVPGDQNAHYSVDYDIDKYWGLVVKRTFPINDKLSVYADIGWLKVDSEMSDIHLAHVDIPMNDMDGYTWSYTHDPEMFEWSYDTEVFQYGVGGEYAFNDRFYGSFGLQRIDNENGMQFGLGLRF